MRSARCNRALVSLAAVVLSAQLAGCGGDSRSVTHHPARHSTRSRKSRRRRRTAGTSTTTTSTVSTSTVTTSTQSVLLPGTGRPPIVVGDMNTPEQFVLGELYAQALVAEGFTVTITRNVGAAPFRLAALEQGTLDMYPEYLDEWDGTIAGDTRRFTTERDAYAAGQAYAETHGLQLLRPSRASDTLGLAVSTDFARAGGLRSLAGLGRLAPAMSFGVPPEFAQSPQGLLALERAYRFHPGTVTSIDLGDQYGDLRAGKIDAAYVNSSDPQLTSGTFRLLSDPLHVLGFGNVVPVVSQKAIADEGPAFAATIDRVSALLDTGVLRQLNAEVSTTTPVATAKAFLQARGVLPGSDAG